MVVLNDILEQVTHLRPNATRSSPRIPTTSFLLRYVVVEETTVESSNEGVISMLGKAIYRSELKKFNPFYRLERINTTSWFHCIEPTSASFAEGDPTSMRKASRSAKTKASPSAVR
ncbi:hypothetical protein GQ600_1755 [Phytophthora cactorum]|nr:hypothetical protein GQ600_1755 [Phytophthora cactorum]